MSSIRGEGVCQEKSLFCKSDDNEEGGQNLKKLMDFFMDGPIPHVNQKLLTISIL